MVDRTTCDAHSQAIAAAGERITAHDGQLLEIQREMVAGDNAVRAEVLDAVREVGDDVKTLLRNGNGGSKRNGNGGGPRWALIAVGVVVLSLVGGTILGAAAGREGILWAGGAAAAAAPVLVKVLGKVWG